MSKFIPCAFPNPIEAGLFGPPTPSNYFSRNALTTKATQPKGPAKENKKAIFDGHFGLLLMYSAKTHQQTPRIINNQNIE